ncbi:MAG: hypothetical protein ACSHWW_10085 [Nonlabens sp.]|uniref:hypothetical protein n=1 Tax=Nonlabens sp. TaxID=1888209 RepID=UPI003EF540A7
MLPQEALQLKKSSWIIFLIISELILFLTVAYYFDSLPVVMRAAAVIIPTAATFIFTQHHFKKIQDITANEVIEYTGRINKLVHFKSSSLSRKRNRNNQTRYIIISDKIFHLSSKQIKKCELHAVVRLVMAPRSQVILSVNNI